MNAAKVATVILRHLVPALEQARYELDSAEAAESTSGARSPHVLTPAQAADFLSMSESQLRILTNGGEIPCKRLSDRIVRYSERALLECVEGSSTGRPALQREPGKGVVA